MVYTGVLSALSIILYFIEFPVIPGVNYLMIDVSDLPAIIAGVAMGPGAAVAVELIKALVHVVIKGMGSTMGFGDLINFIVGTALTVPFSLVYRSMTKHGKGKYISLLFAGLSGMAAMAAAGVAANYLIAPPYFKFMLHVELTGAALWAAIGGATILNLLKSAVVALLMVPVIGVAKKRIMPF